MRPDQSALNVKYTPLIFETTPEFFGLWVEDATRDAKPFKFAEYLVEPVSAFGGFFDGGWHWGVSALYWFQDQGRRTFWGPRELINFDVIPIAPTRIKVKAYSTEVGRPVLDALIVRMKEELPFVQPIATVMWAPAAKEVAFDERNAQKRGGASLLVERELTDQMKDTAIKYLHRLWSRKSNSPSKKNIASILGVGDYRTIERWIETWPEIEEQAKREYEQGKKRK